MESIADYLEELHKSDIPAQRLSPAQRTVLYRESLLGVKELFERDDRPIAVPQLRGRFDRAAPGHFHPTPEIFFQISGATEFDCPSGSYLLEAGEVCVMPVGVPHDETYVTRTYPYLTLIMMFWQGGFSLHYGFKHMEGGIHCGEIDRYRPESRTALLEMLQLIAAHGHKGSHCQDAYVRHLLLACVDRLLDGTQNLVRILEDTNTLVHRCRDRVSLHQDEPTFNVSALAEELNYHPDYLSRIFQQDTGQTLSAYISEQRILRAKQMLAGRLTINEIAWSCGFNHSSYFIRVFKQQTGLTPKAYREQLALASR